jgi:hypothetical protein
VHELSSACAERGLTENVRATCENACPRGSFSEESPARTGSGRLAAADSAAALAALVLALNVSCFAKAHTSTHIFNHQHNAATSTETVYKPLINKRRVAPIFKLLRSKAACLTSGPGALTQNRGVMRG